MAINITYLISGDTTDEKVRQDLKISSLLKISGFLKFPKVASISHRIWNDRMQIIQEKVFSAFYIHF